MKLRNKTVVYVKGLKEVTPKGAGGGAELCHVVRVGTIGPWALRFLVVMEIDCGDWSA